MENERQEFTNTLQMQEVLLGCARVLYREVNIEQAIQTVLKRIGRFLGAERSYIFQFYEGKMDNTYEWCADNVSSEKDNLQGMDLSLADSWMPSLKNKECYILEDVEIIRETEPLTYRVLKAQGINSLAAAPLERDGVLVGFIGIDNPPMERIKNIKTLLQMLCYFVMLAFQHDEDKERLLKMSYTDELTGLFNRNKYINDVDDYKLESSIGVAFLDLNGLKQINDQYNHEYGDKMLVECAQIIQRHFPWEKTYRIGGDEFVVLCEGISEEEFKKKIDRLRMTFEKSEMCHPAIGAEWSAKVEDIKKIISAADDKMYVDKKAYHRKHGNNTRYRRQNDEEINSI